MKCECAQCAKQRVRWTLRRAVTAGIVVRPSRCGECDKPCTPQAHHEDYTKPLDVVWLCVTCHGRKRRNRNPRISRAIRMPQSLLDGLRELAEREGDNVNSVATKAFRKYIAERLAA